MEPSFLQNCGTTPSVPQKIHKLRRHPPLVAPKKWGANHARAWNPRGVTSHVWKSHSATESLKVGQSLSKSQSVDPRGVSGNQAQACARTRTHKKYAAETEILPNSETESETETKSAAKSETGTKTKTQCAAETETESETEWETESATESEAELETKYATKSETKSETETDSKMN